MVLTFQINLEVKSSKSATFRNCWGTRMCRQEDTGSGLGIWEFTYGIYGIYGTTMLKNTDLNYFDSYIPPHSVFCVEVAG